MKKYYIIPVNKYAMIIQDELVNSETKAMNYFSDYMSFDMNRYFKAVTEEEYNRLYSDTNSK